MGMDVMGLAPTSETGKHFRNNVWHWHPLWNYCCAVAPDLTAKVRYGHSNDGDGLDAADSQELARRLRAEIRLGRTTECERAHAAEIAAMPNEECGLCGGTGYRAKPPEVGPGTMRCNGCDGAGTRRPHEASYHLVASNVEEFAAFLEDCGGFEIC